MTTPITRILVLLSTLLLTACAASSLPGFQNAYYSYNVPQPLVERIKMKFREHGLGQASVTRDSVGRIQLTGSYQDEDEVDKAFSIVQSIVGLKSTSPFYPQNVRQKRWETAAGKALASYEQNRKAASLVPAKRALVIGINHFMSSKILKDIQGADDAMVVQQFLQKAGYSVTALLGPQATKANIEHALHALDDAIGPNDSVFVYVSSHGNRPVPSPAGDDQRKMSIMAYDTGFSARATPTDNTENELYFQETSVPDTLVQRIAQKPSRTTRMIIDTCFSGDMLDDVKDESTAYILKVNGGQPERAGISLSAWTGPAYTSKGIHFAADSPPAKAGEGAKSTTSVINRNRSGYTIITATSEDEESLGPDSKVGTFPSPLDPARKLTGSFFTQSLFDYLGRYDGKLGPAFHDAQGFTSHEAVEVSGGKWHQVPREFSTIPDPQNNLFD